MKIGIFFGGPAREREISFAGGKTAMETMDKGLFTPVPVFVDSLGNFILINPELLYKSQIRDFYPAPQFQKAPFQIYIESCTADEVEASINAIGKRIEPKEFVQYFDFAFIAMHGPSAEDGALQGLLEWHNMPYSGPGILGSGVGIDKIAQNHMLELAVGLDKPTATLSRKQWLGQTKADSFAYLKEKVGLPFVVKAPHQGSSIGVAFVKKDSLDEYETAMGQCFFEKRVHATQFNGLTKDEQIAFVQVILNLETGLGFPVVCEGKLLNHPQELLDMLQAELTTKTEVLITSVSPEESVLVEGFVNGAEFSCGVIQDMEGNSIALPPTEIVKVVEVFDFNSKYKPGATRKRIPVQASTEANLAIQDQVKKAFDSLGFGVCTRIDGFLRDDNSIVLHDPNTIPGMSPTSLIFKQMAEIGFNVTDSITYFIRQSIAERLKTGKNGFLLQSLLTTLDAAIANRVATLGTREKVEVLIEGDTLEALDNSYALARKTFTQLNATEHTTPLPVLVWQGKKYALPQRCMFKDFAEDLLALIDAPKNELLETTKQKTAHIKQFYAGNVSFDIVEL
jgi:D-alanine-D-alanine ligase